MTSQTSIYKTPEGERLIMGLYDDVLRRWPVPADHLTIETRHGSTFALASGDPTAAPLLLLHGAGTNSMMWGADVSKYSAAHRVYAVDLLGEPGKSAPNRPAWEGPAYAEWIEDVLNGLGVDKARFVGLSQGGWAALKFATRWPERVEKLALLTPGGVVPDKLSFLAKTVFYMMLGGSGLKRMNQMLYAEQSIPEGVTEITSVMMRNFNARMGALPLFTDDELRRLTMPTLLMVGSKDALRDEEKIAARLRQFVPQLTVRIVPGAGHALLNTVDTVMQFLSA